MTSRVAVFGLTAALAFAARAEFRIGTFGAIPRFAGSANAHIRPYVRPGWEF